MSKFKTSNKRGLIFVMSAPSGCGKTTLAEGLLKRCAGLERSVSMTTRPPRAGERDGQDYFFVSRDAFERLRRGRGFLECADVFGHRYGTPRAFVDKRFQAGLDVLLVIDVQGARQIRKACRDRAVLLFILPPSMGALEGRLRKRSSDSAAVIQGRLREASREMACAKEYDYCVVNRDVRRALGELCAIVTAERLRVRRRG